MGLKNKKNQMLFLRLATSALLIPFILWVIIFAPPIVFFILITLISFSLIYELLKFTKNLNWFLKSPVYLFMLIVYWVKYNTYLNKISFAPFSLGDIIIFLVLALMTLEGVFNIFNKLFKSSLKNISFLTFTFLYTTIMFSYIIEVRYLHLNFYEFRFPIKSIAEGNLLSVYYLLYPILICWGYDSGAYFIGKKFGKSKLGLFVSPKKSWEGILGGLLLSLVAYYILVFTMKNLHPQFLISTVFGKPYWYGIGCTWFLATICQTGDLLASVLKRSSGIKNSGKIVLGHGGVLDRVDSSIPTIFVTYILIICSII